MIIILVSISPKIPAIQKFLNPNQIFSFFLSFNISQSQFSIKNKLTCFSLDQQTVNYFENQHTIDKNVKVHCQTISITTENNLQIQKPHQMHALLWLTDKYVETIWMRRTDYNKNKTNMHRGKTRDCKQKRHKKRQDKMKMQTEDKQYTDAGTQGNL